MKYRNNTNARTLRAKELSMKISISSQKTLSRLYKKFTGKKKCVNQAGKALGILCPFSSQGDALSLAGLEQKVQGQLGRLPLRGLSLRGLPHRGLTPFLFLLATTGILLFPQDLMAHTGELLKEEITALEKLFTGGYMRLGLLAVCGFAAIYGIIKQSGWIFASGVLGCVFAYFMKDWILKTFSAVI